MVCKRGNFFNSLLRIEVFKMLGGEPKVSLIILGRQSWSIFSQILAITLRMHMKIPHQRW